MQEMKCDSSPHNDLSADKSLINHCEDWNPSLISTLAWSSGESFPPFPHWPGPQEIDFHLLYIGLVLGRFISTLPHSDLVLERFISTFSTLAWSSGDSFPSSLHWPGPWEIHFHLPHTDLVLRRFISIFSRLASS